MMADLPSIERIRELFQYDPATGVVTNKVRRAKAAAGTVAGGPRGDGYWTLSIDGKTGVLMHRVIWALVTGAWPDGHLDHADLNRSNNRWVNLRLATPAQNMANRKAHADNVSGLKGVHFMAPGQWRARIYRNGKNHHLGVFRNPQDAASAYAVAAKSHDGEFARAA